MVFEKKVYDALKWIAMYLLPAIGTLYFALSNVWGLPYGEQIVGTITAIDAFLGAVLGISKACYNGDGKITYDKATDEATIELADDSLLTDGNVINLKVKGA